MKKRKTRYSPNQFHTKPKQMTSERLYQKIRELGFVARDHNGKVIKLENGDLK